MVPEVTDVWFRSHLTLVEIAGKLSLGEVTEDTENYWSWVIGTFGDARLDITRTHTRPADKSDTRIFVVDGFFSELLLTELVSRLRTFIRGSIACGRWEHHSGNDFNMVLVREFSEAGNN